MTTWAYDANRNLSSTTDANDRVTTYAYDVYNQPTAITRPDGTSLSTAYDASGNVASQSDGLGTTTFGWDGLNRRTSSTDAMGRVTTFGYDKGGNLRSVKDAAGRTATHSYDAADQLVAISYSDGVTPNVGFGYDLVGQRTSMVDGSGTSSYAYDSLRRLTRHTNGAGATVSYGYSLTDEVTSITYPGSGRVVTRTYDAARRMTSVTDWLAKTTTFAYDANSNLTTQLYPNATVATFAYDAADRSESIVQGGITTLSSLTYARDKVGLVTAENAKTFGYDNRNRLTTQSTGPAMSYTYNNGDLPTRIAAAGGDTYDFIYNSAHQIKSYSLTGANAASKAHDVLYDANGNRTQVRHLDDSSGEMVITNVAAYGWDQANRLVQANGVTQYGYDGDGLRTNKTGTGATTFSWNMAEGVPLVIQDGTTSFISGPNGLPLEQISGSGQASFFHQDQLGSTRMLSDATGVVVASYDYDPYGNPTSKTGTGTTPLQFAGEYRDAETGLYYLRARYYHPQTGQFLSRDPIETQTRKPYSYAASSPLNFIDPTGLAECKGTNQSGRRKCQPSAPSARQTVAGPNGALRDIGSGRFAPNPARVARFQSGRVHGNSFASQRPTTLYQLTDAETGAHLKWGITSKTNPMARYTAAQLQGKILNPIQVGSRAEMAALERLLVERLPGPLNCEPWAGAGRALAWLF